MAKYTITYKCGCTREVQLFGKFEDRERRIKWLETQTCLECQFEAENAHAAEAKEQRGLADLTGSEKQVSWANSIREAAYECLDALYEYATDNNGKQMLDGWRQKMDAQTTAKWWIDNRFGLPKYPRATTPEGSKDQAKDNVIKFHQIF